MTSPAPQAPVTALDVLTQHWKLIACGAFGAVAVLMLGAALAMVLS